MKIMTTESMDKKPITKRRFALAVPCLVLALFFGLFGLMGLPKTANACTNCGCINRAHVDTRKYIDDQHEITADHITNEFTLTRDWIENYIWNAYLLPSLKKMARELGAAAMQQAYAIGMFLDAENQLETQLLLQRKKAAAHKDYHPSTSMCVFGTTTRGLAQAENNADFNTFVFSRRSIDRQMGHRSSISAPGQFRDREKRMSEFKKYFCHNRDNNGFLLEGFCSQTNIPLYSNVDIDFGRIMNRSKTLDIDFTDAIITGREQHVLALADNLFSNELMLRLPETLMQNNRRPDLLMDIRSIIAKRSVAEHSFFSQIGLRSKGPDASETIVYPYIESMMQTAGLYYDNNEIANMIGWHSDRVDDSFPIKQPSYDTQMELVTKIMYQNAAFFTNLYDKPANIERQKASMQAIGLMQDFDTWDSFLRTEAALAVLLELELMKLEDTEL